MRDESRLLIDLHMSFLIMDCSARKCVGPAKSKEFMPVFYMTKRRKKKIMGQKEKKGKKSFCDFFFYQTNDMLNLEFILFFFFNFIEKMTNTISFYNPILHSWTKIMIKRGEKNIFLSILALLFFYLYFFSNFFFL